MTTRVVLDEIDEAARGLAVAVVAGELVEHEARARMAGLLLSSRVHESVAWSYGTLPVQVRFDLAENLLACLVGRILDVDSTFDLTRIQTGSLCGWARVLAVKVAQYDRAVRPAGMDAVTRIVDPTPPPNVHGAGGMVGDEETSTFHAAMAFEGLTAEDAVLAEWDDSERFSQALERVEHLTGHARGSVRDHASAAALREVLRLPALCVPESTDERAELLALVLHDETLARRSLVQMAALVCTEPPSRPAPGDEPVGELLLSLWDDFHPDQLESLMVRPTKAAHILAVDALTPMPKPSRAAVRTMARVVRAASAQKDWRMTQEGVVVSFLATCTEPVSRFDDTNDDDSKQHLRDAAKEAAGRWPMMAARLAAFPGAPLGSSVDEVGARLREVLNGALAQDTDDRIASRRQLGTRDVTDVPLPSAA